jgi:hypothetical protein
MKPNGITAIAKANGWRKTTYTPPYDTKWEWRKKLLTNGDPIPKGPEWGMTDAIRELAKLGEDADEANEENRDYGFDLYVQHELNGGRESEHYGCTHPETVYVVDGPKNRITTGHTKVWDFCTECGSMIDKKPAEFYSILHVQLFEYTKRDAQGSLDKWIEMGAWMIEKSPYAKPDVLTVDEAKQLIVDAIARR